METLTIQYSCRKIEKTSAISAGIFLFGISLYNITTEALINNYGIVFFFGIIGVALGLSVFFIFSLWQSQPLISINNQEIHTNLPKLKNKTIEWHTIKNIAVGGGHLKITTTEDLFLDFSPIKYSDINRLKSKIVEICDTKGITFHND